MDYKKYVFSLRFYILFATLLLIISALVGCFLIAKQFPHETKEFLEQATEKFQGILDMHPVLQWGAIFLNNASVLVLSIVFGFGLGIVPFISLISNGAILGIVFFFGAEQASLSTVVFSIVPHGIVELPVIILGASVGIRLGVITSKKVFALIFSKEDKYPELEAELKQAVKFFVDILLPLLALAAAIEVFITPYFIK